MSSPRPTAQQRRDIDRTIYNMLVDVMVDHPAATREQADREVCRQTGYSLRTVRAAIRRHATTRSI